MFYLKEAKYFADAFTRERCVIGPQIHSGNSVIIGECVKFVGTSRFLDRKVKLAPDPDRPSNYLSVNQLRFVFAPKVGVAFTAPHSSHPPVKVADNYDLFTVVSG